MGEELLECPFCGRPAVLEEVAGAGVDKAAWSPSCSNEDCLAFITAGSYARKIEAITAWNTRLSAKATAAPQGDASGLVEILLKYSRMCDARERWAYLEPLPPLPTVEEIGRALRAAATALSAPEGWRLVPVEPDEAMLSAAQDDWYHGHGPESRTLHGENIVGIYRAMVNAAPQPVTPRKP